MQKQILIVCILSLISHTSNGMDSKTPSRPISPLAAQLIEQGNKPLRIWPVGDVDFPNGIAITTEGKAFHHWHLLGIGTIYTGEIDVKNISALLKLFTKKQP